MSDKDGSSCNGLSVPFIQSTNYGSLIVKWIALKQAINMAECGEACIGR